MKIMKLICAAVLVCTCVKVSASMEALEEKLANKKKLYKLGCRNGPGGDIGEEIQHLTTEIQFEKAMNVKTAEERKPILMEWFKVFFQDMGNYKLENTMKDKVKLWGALRTQAIIYEEMQPEEYTHEWKVLIILQTYLEIVEEVIPENVIIKALKEEDASEEEEENPSEEEETEEADEEAAREEDEMASRKASEEEASRQAADLREAAARRAQETKGKAMAQQRKEWAYYDSSFYYWLVDCNGEPIDGKATEVIEAKFVLPSGWQYIICDTDGTNTVYFFQNIDGTNVILPDTKIQEDAPPGTQITVVNQKQ